MAFQRLVCISLRTFFHPDSLKMGNTIVNFKQIYGPSFQASYHFMSHSIVTAESCSPVIGRSVVSSTNGSNICSYRQFSTSSHLYVLKKKLKIKSNRPEKIVEAESPSEIIKKIQNQKVQLFDDKNLFIHVMTLKAAEESARKAGFKLTEMTGGTDGVDGMKAYKYITGEELFQMTMERKRKKKLKSKKGIKEIILSAAIDEHDFKTKMDQIREFLDDYVPVKVKIVSKKTGADQEARLGKKFRQVFEVFGTEYVVEEATASRYNMKIMLIKNKKSPSDSSKTQPGQDIKTDSLQPSGSEFVASSTKDQRKSDDD